MWEEKWYQQMRGVEERKGGYKMRDEKKGFAIRGDMLILFNWVRAPSSDTS